jgi:hypothetical protein
MAAVILEVDEGVMSTEGVNSSRVRVLDNCLSILG